MDKIYICKKCGEPLTEDDFYANRTQGKSYRKTTCKKCDNENRKTRRSTWKPHTIKQKEEAEKRRKKYQKSPKTRAVNLIRDARRSDKQAGREHRLEKEWVHEKISSPCSYCGETGLMMTLDRIDNAIGHVPENVLPACERCNYFRRDMPFDAWKLLVSGMRKARERGLFKNWTCGVHRRFSKISDSEPLGLRACLESSAVPQGLVFE